jgi:hypothetical protein
VPPNYVRLIGKGEGPSTHAFGSSGRVPKYVRLIGSRTDEVEAAGRPEVCPVNRYGMAREDRCGGSEVCPVNRYATGGRTSRDAFNGLRSVQRIGRGVSAG